MDQLASPGRMIIPAGEEFQRLVCVDKDEEGRIHTSTLMDVRYVPLTDAQRQWTQ